jgi:nicotinate phosphoribosyltransferase
MSHLPVFSAPLLVPPAHLWVAPDDRGLLTDLYQLTMAACYQAEGLDDRLASFEVFVRRLPTDFGYLIAMGLQEVLDYVLKFGFSEAQVEALQRTGLFDTVPGVDRFWRQLAGATFSGSLWAVAEGTAIGPNEPILRIEAPLWQAQLLETYILNVVNYQTLIASRSARLRDAAGPEAQLLEFGSRRAFGPQAALWAARAALAAGFDATSNVLAALQLGRNPSGTMAHALVMALTALEGSEDQAFAAFRRSFPQGALLIDTYDAIAAARRLADQGQAVPAIRLDSGDLLAQAKTIRELLPETKILVSGDLDEREIARLRSAQAPIDGYGIGTKLVSGSPVNGVYKLVEIDGIPVMKEAEGKLTYPGRKQIFRGPKGDRLGLADETAAVDERPLLTQWIDRGTPCHPDRPEALDQIAARTRQSIGQLSADQRRLEAPIVPAIDYSQALLDLTEQTRRGDRR